MKDHYNTALNFWENRNHYPEYPNTLQRRLIDTNYVVSKISTAETVLDLGCGDGAMLLSLREFTNVKLFYGYDVSSGLLSNLMSRWGWGQMPGLITLPIDFTNLNILPTVDVTLALGLFPYIFEVGHLRKILKNIKSDLLIVRAPCTLNKDDEIINKFSEDLGEDYASIYRTVPNYISILSEQFIVSDISRAYPDEIESKYDTKHFFFVCEAKNE